MKLRPYQAETIDKIYDYWGSGKGSAPLAVVPTGGGKTPIYNSMMRDMMEDPSTNVLMVTHRKKLISQGAATFKRFMPKADVAIYSAGLREKRLTGRAVFAGIQSIYKRAYDMDRVDVCFIDECHLVPNDNETMYGQFLADLKVCNSNIKLIGLTATPFRMSSGMLHEGQGAIFDGIAHEVKILYLMEQGYLTRIVSKPAVDTIPTDGVGKVGGEWITSELAIAASSDELIRSSVAETIHWGRTQSRRKWLIFACNVGHAEKLQAEYERCGIDARVVASAYGEAHNDSTLDAHARGEFVALINVDILTTGYDDPEIDLIALKRSTLSTGLFIQIVGRGTRPLYAPGFDLDTQEGRLMAIAMGPKPDCLLLDFGNNVLTHGFIDQIEVTSRKTGKADEKDPPLKACPSCRELIPAGARSCHHCGHEFPPPAPNHSHIAYSGAVTSDQVKPAEPEWLDVNLVLYAKHSKAGKPDSVKVTYICGLTRVSEWLCPDHEGVASSKYRARMKALGAYAMTTEDALIECKNWVKPSRIKVRPRKDEPKFMEIVQLSYEPREVKAVESTLPTYEETETDDLPF